MLSSHNVTMTTAAKISELKNRLSYYLARVRRGESILVLDRDRVIARIEPAGGESDPSSDAELDALERRGVIRRATRRLSRGWQAQRPKVKADVVQALLDERAEGR
jgi:antitoxin (DNA-binding transcriptional repressor) of toxin-antitoxin stability system